VLHTGMTKTKGISGRTIYEGWCGGAHEEVAAYWLRDVEMARLIYRKMAFVQT